MITTSEDTQDFLTKTKKSEALYERALKVFPSGSTRAPFVGTPYPFYAQSASGCYITDVDGNEYIDFVNNMGPMILGHHHPAVEKAVSEQVASLWCGAPTELEVKLGEKIFGAFPFGDKVLFTPSGTEALMKLVRAARASSGKKKLAVDSGSFHGTSDTFVKEAGVPPELSELIVRYRFNDESSVRKVIRESKDELAAVVLEAVLGPAGSIPPTKSFLETIREETQRLGILLIFDEVVTGFRVARGGISELYSVKPDAVSLGKIIGGGFPVGAFLGPEEIMKEFSYSEAKFPYIGKPPISHGGTFNAHPVTMAAGLATLGELKPETYGHLQFLGDAIRRILQEVSDENKLPNSVTGVGSIFRLHFSSQEVRDSETAEHTDEFSARLFDFLMLERGVSLPRFHSAFCSTPMGKKEVDKFRESTNESLAYIKSHRHLSADQE